MPKGDPLEVARIAGIQAGKKTSELIPLCHPLPLTHLDISIEVIDSGARIEATARTKAETPSPKPRRPIAGSFLTSLAKIQARNSRSSKSAAFSKNEPQSFSQSKLCACYLPLNSKGELKASGSGFKSVEPLVPGGIVTPSLPCQHFRKFLPADVKRLEGTTSPSPKYHSIE